MARLVGDRYLPESFVSRRRSMRQKIRELRNPVRSFRESNVPGPDVVGKVEDTLMGARDSFVRRDALVSRLRDMASSNDASDEEDEEDEEDKESNRGRESDNTLNV